MTQAHKPTITIDRLNLGHVEDRWQSLVSNSPQINPFADVRWLRAVHDVFGYDLDLWIVRRGDEWLAGLPVFYRRRFGRLAAIHPPQMAYTSIVYASTLSKSQYQSRVTSNHIEATKPLATQIRLAYSSAAFAFLPCVLDVRPWMWDGWSATPTYTYELNIRNALAASASVRNYITKCERVGVSFTTDWNLDRALEPITSTIRRQSVGLGMSQSQFLTLANRLANDGIAWMGTALAEDGTPLATRIQLSLQESDTAFDWVAGSNTERLSQGGAPWLMMRLADEIRQRGYHIWNLCGAQYETIAKFKSEFGGALTHGFVVSPPASLPERIFMRAWTSGSRVKRTILQKRRRD